jgi:Transcriptional regulatory protein, C terminal
MRVHAASGSAAITRTLEQIITESGHSIAKVTDAELVLIDTLHPIKNLLSTAPCIVIGSKNPTHEDSLTAPLAPRQLIRLLRNYSRSQPLMLSNKWSLDLTARNITHPTSATFTLTEKECALLAALMGAHPSPLSRETLLMNVWGMKHDIDTHTLETHIYRLRSKLSSQNPTPCDIITEDGAYKLVVEQPAGPTT